MQGVWFRDSCRRVALAADVSGWVCNELDGSVAAVLEGAADAVGLASLLHYEAFTRLAAGDEPFREEGNVEFLQGRRGARAFGKLQPVSVRAVKESLAASGVEVRPS